jgi:hypothetical protein
VTGRLDVSRERAKDLVRTCAAPSIGVTSGKRYRMGSASTVSRPCPGSPIRSGFSSTWMWPGSAVRRRDGHGSPPMTS